MDGSRAPPLAPPTLPAPRCRPPGPVPPPPPSSGSPPGLARCATLLAQQLGAVRPLDGCGHMGLTSGSCSLRSGSSRTTRYRAAREGPHGSSPKGRGFSTENRDVQIVREEHVGLRAARHYTSTEKSVYPACGGGGHAKQFRPCQIAPATPPCHGTLLAGMDNNEAAVATIRLIYRWSPTSVVMIGIGAGVPGYASSRTPFRPCSSAPRTVVSVGVSGRSAQVRAGCIRHSSRSRTPAQWVG